MKIKGRFSCSVIKKDGSTFAWQKDNMIVDSGYNFLIQAMFETNNRPYPISYIAFGKGSSTTTADMTALEDEITRIPAVWTWNPETRVASISAEYTPSEPVVISEAGLFNAQTGGVMFDRVTFSEKGIDETDMAKPIFDISVI